MFLRGCNRRLVADENGLICAEILNQITKHFGYLGSRTWPYKRGEPQQLQRDAWAVGSLVNIELDRLRYNMPQSRGRSRISNDITLQTHTANCLCRCLQVGQQSPRQAVQARTERRQWVLVCLTFLSCEHGQTPPRLLYLSRVLEWR